MSSQDRAGTTVPVYRESKLLKILGAIAAIIAVPAFLIGIPPVQNKIFRNSPELEIAVVSQIPVFDVRRSLSGLSVSLDGRNLTSTGQELTASRIQIRNVGGSSVTPGDISPSDPIGLRISRGRLIRINRASSNSTHLVRTARLSATPSTIFLNTGLIFDPGDYIELDLIMMNPADSGMAYSALGKVSQQDNIRLVDRREGGSRQNILELAFLGTIWVQLLRVVGYFIIRFGMIAIVALVVARISSWRKARRDSKRSEIVSAAWERVAGFDGKLVLFAISIVSVLGTQASRQFSAALTRKHGTTPHVPVIPDRANVMGTYVDATKESIEQYLKSPTIVSSTSIRLLLRDFNFMYDELIPHDFVELLRLVTEYAEERGAQRYGTGLSNFATSSMAAESKELDC